MYTVRSSITSPPAISVQTAPGSNVVGREPGGSATSSGQAPRSLTRLPPNRVTPSTCERPDPGRDVLGTQDAERRRCRGELGANLGRRQRPDVGTGANAEVGGEGDEVVRAHEDAPRARARSRRAPPPGPERVMDRSRRPEPGHRDQRHEDGRRRDGGRRAAGRSRATRWAEARDRICRREGDVGSRRPEGRERAARHDDRGEDAGDEPRPHGSVTSWLAVWTRRRSGRTPDPRSRCVTCVNCTRKDCRRPAEVPVVTPARRSRSPRPAIRRAAGRASIPRHGG